MASSLFETVGLMDFVILVMPGFISIKVWNLIIPTKSRALKDSFIDALTYSILNFALLFWLILIIQRTDEIALKVICYITIMGVGPVLWPILWKAAATSRLFRGKIINPTPKAWDHFFGIRRNCFILIHLKDGNLVGGLYHQKSFASSYPAHEDIYIEEVWKVDGQGLFVEKIPQSVGMLVTRDSVKYIEMYSLGDQEGENDAKKKKIR